MIKERDKGQLVADVWAMRVMAVRDRMPGPDVWPVLRRQLDTGALKTYVGNAPAHTSLETLARLSGMRWPSATRCEENKQYLGMGADAARSFRG